MSAETQKKFIEKTEDFWGNLSRREDNPSLILAEILEEKGLGVTIFHTATNIYGERLQDCVAVHATLQGKLLLKNITKSVRFEAMLEVFGQLPGSDAIYAGCAFERETQNRLVALCYENKSKIFQKQANRIPIDAKAKLLKSKAKDENYAALCRQRAKQFLGDLQPITLAEIRQIIEGMVDESI